MNVRERLIKLLTESVGHGEHEVENASDMELIVMALEHFDSKIEDFEDHSHTIT